MQSVDYKTTKSVLLKAVSPVGWDPLMIRLLLADTEPG